MAKTTPKQNSLYVCIEFKKCFCHLGDFLKNNELMPKISFLALNNVPIKNVVFLYLNNDSFVSQF